MENSSKKYFKKVGTWSLKNNNLNYELFIPESKKAVIYALVIGATIKYIGSSVKSIKTAMDRFKLGDESQKTNCRIHYTIIQELENNHIVDIYMYTGKETKDVLIAEFYPDWNYQK